MLVNFILQRLELVSLLGVMQVSAQSASLRLPGVVLGGAGLLQGALQSDCLHNNDVFVFLSEALPFQLRNLRSLNWTSASSDAMQDICSF